MEKFVESELKKFCNKDTINNFDMNYKRAIGVKCHVDAMTEDGEVIGQIIYLLDNEKFPISSYIRFNPKWIKWSSKIKNSYVFHIVTPHYCKKFINEPVLEVEVKVFKPKTKSFAIDFVKLNYKQFVNRRLLEFYGDWKHKIVAAIENFDKNLSTSGYWGAINMTVKHYHITQEDLQTALGRRDKVLSTIRNEWIEKKNEYYAQRETERLIATIVSNNDLQEEVDRKQKVFPLKQVSQ